MKEMNDTVLKKGEFQHLAEPELYVFCCMRVPPKVVFQQKHF